MKKFENELKYIAEQTYRRYGIGKNPGIVEKKNNVYFKLIDYMFENTKDIKVYFPKEMYKDADLSDFLEMLSSIDYEYENENGDCCSFGIIGSNGKNKNGYFFYYSSIFNKLINSPIDGLEGLELFIRKVFPLMEMKTHERINIEVEPGTELYEFMKKKHEEEAEDEI